MVSPCLECQQRELEITLRLRQYRRMAQLVTEMTRASVADFRRDREKPIAPLTREQA